MRMDCGRAAKVALFPWEHLTWILEYGIIIGVAKGRYAIRCDAYAAVMELADITDLKSVGFLTRTGSSPVSGSDYQEKSVAESSRLFLFYRKERPLKEKRTGRSALRRR